MPYGIGVDLGGTNIKIVAISDEGQILERTTCGTQPNSPAFWVKTIRQKIKEFRMTRQNQRAGLVWLHQVWPHAITYLLLACQENFRDLKDSIGQTLCRLRIQWQFSMMPMRHCWEKPGSVRQ